MEPPVAVLSHAPSPAVHAAQGRDGNNDDDDNSLDFAQPPASKRRRLSCDDSTLGQQVAPGGRSGQQDALVSRIPRHRLGVRPLGNVYAAEKPNIRSRCGTLAYLPDELLLQLFEAFGARDLWRLGATCRALYALTRFDELWRALFIASPPAAFTWRGSWRSTYLSLPPSLTSVPPVDCVGLYSDALYRPFHCAHAPLQPFVDSIPVANEIARLSDLTAEAFTRDGWADKPFILTEPVKQWRVYRQWSTDELLQRHARTAFRAEAVDWPLERYVEYMNDCADDESPLYLFDHGFVEKMGLRVPEDDTAISKVATGSGDKISKDLRDQDVYDYLPPATFDPDLFTHLGAQRPHHRWLILGPARSGSTFHKDPNATSAWNAVLRGAKYWIMFPPASPPPGVFVSADQAEVTSPLSIAEWLLAFHADARRVPGCREGVCREGEVLHVPSGWWHLVLNLDASLALTQNFVPRAHLGRVLSFLRDRPEQVTGFGRDVSDPFGLFVERLTASCGAELVRQGLDEADRCQRDSGNGARRTKGKWEALVEDSAETCSGSGGGGFSFGFAADDDEDDGDNGDDDDDDKSDESTENK